MRFEALCRSCNAPRGQARRLIANQYYNFSSSKENKFNYFVKFIKSARVSGFLFMKTKNLVIIFILFLLIAMGSGLAVYLTKEKNQPVVNERPSTIEKQAESLFNEPNKAADIIATSAKEKIIQPKKTGQPQIVSAPAEEKIKAVMIIGGVKYEVEIKADSSVYDFMNLLKAENKINFSGKNYSELGFFIEEINGLKNNPVGENWFYYVNGRPAQVGISNYLIKADDIIEWKYEKKSF